MKLLLITIVIMMIGVGLGVYSLASPGLQAWSAGLGGFIFGAGATAVHMQLKRLG